MGSSVNETDLGDLSEVLMEIMFWWQHPGWTVRTAAQRDRKEDGSEGPADQGLSKRALHRRHHGGSRSPGVRERSLETRERVLEFQPQLCQPLPSSEPGKVRAPRYASLWPMGVGQGAEFCGR